MNMEQTTHWNTQRAKHRKTDSKRRKQRHTVARHKLMKTGKQRKNVREGDLFFCLFVFCFLCFLFVYSIHSFVGLFVCSFVTIKPEKLYSGSCWGGSKPPGSGHTWAEAQNLDGNPSHHVLKKGLKGWITEATPIYGEFAYALRMHVTSLHPAVVNLSSDDDAAASSDRNDDFSSILLPLTSHQQPCNHMATCLYLLTQQDNRWLESTSSSNGPHMDGVLVRYQHGTPTPNARCINRQSTSLSSILMIVTLVHIVSHWTTII